MPSFITANFQNLFEISSDSSGGDHHRLGLTRVLPPTGSFSTLLFCYVKIMLKTNEN